MRSKQAPEPTQTGNQRTDLKFQNPDKTFRRTRKRGKTDRDRKPVTLSNHRFPLKATPDSSDPRSNHYDEKKNSNNETSIKSKNKTSNTAFFPRIFQPFLRFDGGFKEENFICPFGTHSGMERDKSTNEHHSFRMIKADEGEGHRKKRLNNEGSVEEARPVLMSYHGQRYI